MKPKPDEENPPLLSQAGNPFPPGLKPVFVPLTPPAPGRTWDSVWPRPLPENPPPPDFSGCITTEDYLHDYIPPEEGWPRFKLRLAPRGPGETEAQYACYRRDVEAHYLTHGVCLGLMQMLASHLGNFHRCAEATCRRAGACVARRDEDRYALFFAIFPPCVPLDLDIIESYRTEVREELARWAADRKALGLPVDGA